MLPPERPLRLRLDNPEYGDAWAALWGAPLGPDQASAALRAKWRARREKAEAYPGWVLDQAGIESALVSADRLGPGQGPPRFLSVPMADELLFPSGNRRPRFRQILSECGLDDPPATLGQYVSQVLTPTLARWKQAGAVAVKLAVAYRRSLDFGAETQDAAERAYAKSPGADTNVSPVLSSAFDEREPRLSPDGKWLAYTSNESGVDEVYVVPYPGLAGKWQISVGEPT